MTTEHPTNQGVKVKTITKRVLYLLPLVLLLLPVAQGATVQTATGTFTTSATTISVNTVDGYTVITQSLLLTTTGGIAGTLSGSDVAIITPTLTGFLSGRGTFTGIVLGRSGTVGIGFAGTFSPITGQLNLQASFLQGTGTGQLTGISGQGTVQGVFNVGGTYTFSVSFRK